LLIQIGNDLGLGLLDFLKGIVTLLFKVAKILFSLELLMKPVLHLLHLARMKLIQLFPGVGQFRLAGILDLFKVIGVLQLQLDKLLLQASGHLSLLLQFSLMLR
jgi:hypothetical protein